MEVLIIIYFKFIFEIYSFATVFICLILSVLATVREYETIASSILMQTVSGVGFRK